MKNKQTYLLNLLVLVFCLSISVFAQQNKTNKGGKPDPAETSVEKVEEERKFLKELLADSESDSRDLKLVPPEGSKYIMKIENHSIETASELIGKMPIINNGISIKLTGTHSPNSPKDFNTAYLIFVDSPIMLKPPKVVQKGDQKILMIWYPSSYAATLKQVLDGTKPVYCWIKNFGKSDQNYTHIYADVHAAY